MRDHTKFTINGIQHQIETVEFENYAIATYDDIVQRYGVVDKELHITFSGRMYHGILEKNSNCIVEPNMEFTINELSGSD